LVNFRGNYKGRTGNCYVTTEAVLNTRVIKGNYYLVFGSF